MARPFWKPNYDPFEAGSHHEREAARNRMARAAAALVGVIVVGTFGYVLLGMSVLDAFYQTIISVTTVGFQEVEPFSDNGKIFTSILILVGVGTALYALTAVIETLFEGRLEALLGRRRMERNIANAGDHVVICGWGRVGRAIADSMASHGLDLIVIDNDEEQSRTCPHPCLVADATDDDILRQAGVDRARSLVAALDSDADNLFVTMSARAMQSDLFIVSRARSEANEQKLFRAGADRVVNPQSIGGSRMAAFVLHPNVAEFLDVVMHDGSLEFRLGELVVEESSPLVGNSLEDAHIRGKTGALVLALRDPAGHFRTNPPPSTIVEAGEVLIAIGTKEQLAKLGEVAGQA